MTDEPTPEEPDRRDPESGTRPDAVDDTAAPADAAADGPAADPVERAVVVAGAGLLRARAFVRAMPRRRRVVAGATAVIVVAAAVTWLVWPDGRLGPDVTVDADRTVPLIEELPEEVDPEDAAAGGEDTEIPTTDDEPAWTVDAGGDDRAGLRAVDGGYVVVGDGTLAGLDDDGDETWSRDTDGSIDIGDTAITDSTDVEDDESWPGKDKTTVLDAKTGGKLWSDATASFVSTWHDTVYLSVCQGGQDGELGECVVSARDPHTGAPRWSRPTYASTSVVDAAADGSFVVFESHVTSGPDIKYTVVDADTGAVLPGGFDQDGYGGGDLLVVGDLVIGIGGDDNPADGCQLPATATNVRSGAKAWEREFGVDAEEGGDYCGDLPDPYGDRVMAYNGKKKAVVVDLTTGKTEWTGPKDVRPRYSDGERALVAVKGGDLALYDTGSDKRLWKLPGGSELGGVLFTKKHVYVNTEDYFVNSECWVRVDASGDPRLYPGSCAGSGEDWIATATEDGELSFFDVD